MFGIKKQTWKSVFTALCLMMTLNPSLAKTDDETWCETACKWGKYTGIAAGAVGAIAAAPPLLGAAGFGSAGIAAGSLAAKAVSVIYGGAIPAGGVVAGLQSAGAAGIGVAANGVIGTVGAGAGYVTSKIFGCEDLDENCNKRK